MRLHVGVLRAEELLRPRDGDLLDDVDVLAAAVVPLARIAFRVLVGEDRALRLEDRATRRVLRGDEFEVVLLPSSLTGDRRGDVRIDRRQGAIDRLHLWLSM